MTGIGGPANTVVAVIHPAAIKQESNVHGLFYIRKVFFRATASIPGWSSSPSGMRSAWKHLAQAARAPPATLIPGAVPPRPARRQLPREESVIRAIPQSMMA
jgi:hypothetical protein